MESNESSAVYSREVEVPFVIEEEGAVEGERLEWIAFASLLKLQESWWSGHAMSDSVRALRLEKLCEEVGPAFAQDLVLLVRLDFLDMPDLGEGLARFDRRLLRVFDGLKKRYAAREAHLKRSLPPKPKSVHPAA